MRSTRRTLNFTNRKRIDAQHVHAVAREDGGSGRLEVVKLEFESYDIPDQSPIILETRTRRDGVLRAELGSTPNPQLPGFVELHPEFFHSARLSIKVLDPDGSGRIIALAEDIHFDIPLKEGIRSLLPTQQVDDLGERIWRLRAETNGFVLEINRYFPHVGEVVRHTNPAFLALVMPEIIRQIALLLTSDSCEVAMSIQEKWSGLFDGWYSDHSNLKSERPEDWADAVAAGFAKKVDVSSNYRKIWNDD